MKPSILPNQLDKLKAAIAEKPESELANQRDCSKKEKTYLIFYIDDFLTIRIS